MEQQQPQQLLNHLHNNNNNNMDPNDGGNNTNNNNGSSLKGGQSNFLCRQSSTRWTPTTDQIRILKDLYYNDGVRSPSAEQIQRISADLRKYGKIEGKNVFYWFQNHKARERQKKRFTNDQPQAAAAASSINVPPLRSNIISPNNLLNSSHSWKPAAAAPQWSYGGYGPHVTMEKSFRDCSISSAGGWVGFDQYGGGNNSFFDHMKSSSVHHEIDEGQVVALEDEDDDEYDHHEDHHHHQEDHHHHQEIETLPLFPTHREEDMISGFYGSTRGNIKQYGSSSTAAYPWYGGGDHCHDGITNGGAALELSLNSFTSQYSSNMF